MKSTEAKVPITTCISILIGIFTLFYIANDRTDEFTFLTIIGYIGATVITLITTIASMTAGIALFGNKTKLDESRPSYFWIGIIMTQFFHRCGRILFSTQPAGHINA